MHLRHNNAKLRRQSVLLDDVFGDEAYMVEVHLEDGTIMVFTTDDSENWVLQREEEAVTSFWLWFFSMVDLLFVYINSIYFAQ